MRGHQLGQIGTFDVAYIRRELGDVVHVAHLSWGVRVLISDECCSERLVVCVNVEGASLDEVAKVLDSFEDGK